MTSAGSLSTDTRESILRSLESETDTLLDRIQGQFLDIDLQGQPLLDGLTGGHILTHIARSADGMADELLTAMGRPVPHPDLDRQWEVERGADRPGAVLIDDVIESAGRLNAAVTGVNDWTAYDSDVQDIPGRRLVQLLIHHADLGRPWESVSDDTAEIALPQLTRVMRHELAGIRLVSQPRAKPFARDSSDEVVVVEGDAAALLAWASGRTSRAARSDPSLPRLDHRIWF